MKTALALTAVLAVSGLAPSVAIAQYGMPGGTPMTFFVTSRPIGDGGNLGGLAGADAHCQQLAQTVGVGNRTWRAYLSTQARPGQPAVNARDRIGTGPWYNFDGVMIARDVAHLHGDTIELARLGNNLTKRTGLTEKGQIVPGLNDYKVPRDSDWEVLEDHALHQPARDADGFAARRPGIPARARLYVQQLDEQSGPRPRTARRAGSRPRQAERADRIPRSQRRRQRLMEFVTRDEWLQSDRAQQDAWRRHVLLLRDKLRDS